MRHLKRSTWSGLGLLAAVAVAGCPGPEETPAPANAPPLARFSAPAWIGQGEEARFDASASFDPDGTLVSYLFLFGDATPSVESGSPRVAHAFGNPGLYTVRLVVTDDDGESHEARHQVAVTREPPPPCGEDDPCPSNQRCRDGLCFNEGPGDACATDADCLDPVEGCYGGACTLPECEGDADCGAGASCRGGLCQPLPPATDGGVPADGGEPGDAGFADGGEPVDGGPADAGMPTDGGAEDAG